MILRIGDTVNVERELVFKPQTEAEWAEDVRRFRLGLPMAAMTPQIDTFRITPDVVSFALAHGRRQAEERHMMPSMGRIVHYLEKAKHESERDKIRAALIIDCLSGQTMVNLKVFAAAGDYVELFVEQGDGVGQWRWPPRV